MRVPTLDYPRAVLLVVLLVTNVALVAGVTTSGNALGPYNYEWDGGSTLRAELGAASEEAVVARTPDDYRVTDPSSAVAVVPVVQRVQGGTGVAGLQRFLARGGTVVVAGEGGDMANALLGALGAETRIEGTPLRDDRYNDGTAELPRARNVSDHPMVADVGQLTLNEATTLDLPGPDRPAAESVERGANDDVEVLVRTSAFGYRDRNGNESLDETEELGRYPVAAVESVEAGQVVVVSDTTVFTNAMLERDGNRAFVRGIGESRETSVVDYTHGPAMPPLTYALLTVRAEPALQVLVGLLPLAGLALWLAGPSLPSLSRVRRRIGGDRTAPEDVGLDEDELAAVLESRHPEWDADRIARVSQTIIRQRREGDVDD